MNHQVWNSIINNDQFILNNKKIRIFPMLKTSKDYSKLLIDNESFSFITIREISNLITKIICKHLVFNNFNPLKISIVDSTAGVGGNTLSFLKFFGKTIAIEICPMRYNYLLNNIDIYEFDNKKCVNMDFCNYYKNNIEIDNPDVIFMDPPWGGIGYKNSNNLRLKLGEMSIEDIIIDIFKKFSSEINYKKTKFIVLKLPKNYDIEFFYNKLHEQPFGNKKITNYLYFLSKMLLIICELKNI
jgi:16S rRNA G966 N2-methylase RsmD